jgi:hypothetical protein
MVVGMDALVDARHTTMSGIAEFVGARDVPPPARLPRLNQGDRGDRPAADTESLLREFFEGPDRDLRELLLARQPERPLPGWLGEIRRGPAPIERRSP